MFGLIQEPPARRSRPHDPERPRVNRAAAPSEPLYTTTSHDGERHLSTEIQLPHAPTFSAADGIYRFRGIYQGQSVDMQVYIPLS